jgi:hypothetical protein
MIPTISDARALEEAFLPDNYLIEGRCAGQGWAARLMRRIRRITHLNPSVGFWSVVENLVWGLSPGSSILLLALTILCVRMYLNLGHDYLSAVVAYLGESGS